MVIWSEPAKADLRAIFSHIANDSKFYARKVSQDIIEKSEVLDRLPRSGRVVPELGHPDVREIAAYSYRVIYEIRDPDIYVLTVVHKRRDIQPDSIPR